MYPNSLKIWISTKKKDQLRTCAVRNSVKNSMLYRGTSSCSTILCVFSKSSPGFPRPQNIITSFSPTWVLPPKPGSHCHRLVVPISGTSRTFQFSWCWRTLFFANHKNTLNLGQHKPKCVSWKPILIWFDGHVHVGFAADVAVLTIFAILDLYT